MAKIDRIRRISNQEKLLEIALGHPEVDYQYAAIETISSQAMLKQIVQNVQNVELQMLAVSKISDTFFLRDIVLDQSLDPFVRVTALKGVSDPAVMQELLSDPNPEVRREAILKVDDVHLLIEMVNTSRDHVLRKRAAEKIESEEVLMKIVLNDPSPMVQQTAYNRIHSVKVLKEIQRRMEEVSPVMTEHYSSLDVSAD